MFSKKLNKELRNLGINPSESSSVIRYALEDNLDNTVEENNAGNNHRYIEAERVYSIFMEEYTAMLDAGDSLFN
jgi:hypothetical protein